MRHVVRPHDKDGGTKCLWEVAFHNGIKTHLKSKFNSYIRKGCSRWFDECHNKTIHRNKQISWGLDVPSSVQDEASCT